MGAVLPRFENVKDAWGIPVLHIHQKYTNNESEMAKDSMHVADELCRRSGFEILGKHCEMSPPSESIHELGTCRMGDDPKTSVLNNFNQSHDTKNLFVIDGSSFTSGGPQNPTLTILALAMRASEYLADLMCTKTVSVALGDWCRGLLPFASKRRRRGRNGLKSHHANNIAIDRRQRH